MTSLTATTEIDPVWSFFGESVDLLTRADVLVLNSRFLSHGAIATGLRQIRDAVETFPSVVEIAWYGKRGSGSDQETFLSEPGLIGGAPIERGAPVSPEFPPFLEPIVGVWKDLATNVLFQMTHASAPSSQHYFVLSTTSAAIETGAPPDSFVFQISGPVHSSLSTKIRAVYYSTQLDHDAAETARRAVNDAIKFVDFNLPRGEPLVMLSDDGVLSLQWRSGNLGVMLVFTGDGTGTYSIKQSGGSYAIGAKDFRLEDGLTKEVRAAIDTRAVA